MGWNRNMCRDPNTTPVQVECMIIKRENAELTLRQVRAQAAKPVKLGKASLINMQELGCIFTNLVPSTRNMSRQDVHIYEMLQMLKRWKTGKELDTFSAQRVEVSARECRCGHGCMSVLLGFGNEV
ncbi:unnamed protein product [Protopolystoma xenopodis]|uniref:Uncharacterized protein n=1 Tax=Protopolystoma xenopodis TaxID=117903 RepID=A0A448X1K1_9PLAT|nr:unnamed protein product [Protopolystoma xenopodis]